MGRICKEVTGQVFCFIGFLGVIIICGIPMWRVTTRIGANIVSGQIVWDGLWMNCVMQSTGQMQCNIHQFLLRLARDLQGARALVVSAVVIAVVGIALTFVGSKCTSCLSNASSRAKVVILGGVICIVAGVICLIPVCWSAAFTITDFQNPVTIDTQKRELGACIYIGWASSGLLIIGGAILCSSCPPNDKMYQYYPAQTFYPGQYAYGGPYSRPGSVMTPGPYVPGKGSYVPTKYVEPTRTPTVRSQYAPTSYL